MAKRKQKQMKYKMTFEFNDQTAKWVIKVPELPGFVAVADNIEAASKIANEEIKKYLQKLASSTGVDRRFSGKLVVRMTPELHRKLYIQAKSEEISLNELIILKLMK